MKLLIIQFGNYGEAEHRFAKGGGETYYAQRYTVGYLAELARRGSRVCIISLGENVAYEQLPSGVESIGIRLYPGRFHRPRTRELIRMAETWQPTHVLLSSPIVELLHWAVRAEVDILPMFADSFHARGFRRRMIYRRLSAALNNPVIRWVVNHGQNAAEDLVRIGVEGHKVLPFDWPALLSPSELPPKRAPIDASAITLTYVGQVCAAKGVGELIRAVAHAKAKGARYQARIIGRGDIKAFRAVASRLSVEEQIDFIGSVSHDRVVLLMNEGDVVVVPSRREYPEGMPQTIYEGLASRSPVVVSDHPMFNGRVVHRKSGMVFRAGDALSLFETIDELVSDAALYERLSKDADDICLHFQGPLKWDHVITHWLNATPEDDAWLRRFAIGQ
jgi:glycosyltransferase involved in cell wall biosynthesis